MSLTTPSAPFADGLKDSDVEKSVLNMVTVRSSSFGQERANCGFYKETY